MYYITEITPGEDLTFANCRTVNGVLCEIAPGDVITVGFDTEDVYQGVVGQIFEDMFYLKTGLFYLCCCYNRVQKLTFGLA